MKIAILTQPLHTNYGGLLQAYALQTVLERMGHEVLIVDIPIRKSLYEDFRIMAGLIKRKYILRQKNIDTVFIYRPTQSEEEIIKKNTNKFIKEHINTTERIPSVKKIYKLKKYQFDAYVVGSDQVWRPMFSPGLLTYYLDFLAHDSKVKRIGYAVSFGTDEWEYDDDLTAMCGRLAQRFDAISVREDSAVELCNKKFGVNAVHVLDPTMLLEKEDYIALTNINQKEVKNNGTLMAYVLDSTADKDNIVHQIADYLHLTINLVMPKKKYSKESRVNINDCVFPPVTDWLRGFMDADFVVTDSFHGTVFSIIFNKSFVVIKNEKRGGARFTSLLKMFNLEDRIISIRDGLSIELLKAPIDFNAVNELRKNHQETAIAFLKKHLNTTA